MLRATVTCSISIANRRRSSSLHRFAPTPTGTRTAQYNPQNPQASHFTQVVWKATTQLGCAVRDGCTGIFDPKFGVSPFSVFFTRHDLIA